MIVKLLLIQIVICFLIDLSGFIPSVEEKLSRWLKIRAHIPRPFSCSLCMCFWINLLYIICTGNFTIWYFAIVSILSFFSKNITGFLRWVSEFLVWIEGLLYRLIR